MFQSKNNDPQILVAFQTSSFTQAFNFRRGIIDCSNRKHILTWPLPRRLLRYGYFPRINAKANTLCQVPSQVRFWQHPTSSTLSLRGGSRGVIWGDVEDPRGHLSPQATPTKELDSSNIFTYWWNMCGGDCNKRGLA